jgi:hypothetical protein
MRRASSLLFLLAFAGALVWAGCPEVRSHIYAAQLYDPDADCLYPGTVLDIVPGPPADEGGPVCDAICISDLDGQVFISAECPPLPVEFDLDTGSLPACEKAFEARCRQCPFPDSGFQIICDAGEMDAHPDVTSDASHDAEHDALDDARRDAPEDAAKDAPADAADGG